MILYLIIKLTVSKWLYHFKRIYYLLFLYFFSFVARNIDLKIIKWRWFSTEWEFRWLVFFKPVVLSRQKIKIPTVIKQGFQILEATILKYLILKCDCLFSVDIIIIIDFETPYYINNQYAWSYNCLKHFIAKRIMFWSRPKNLETAWQLRSPQFEPQRVFMSYDDNNLPVIKVECPIGIAIQLNLLWAK